MLVLSFTSVFTSLEGSTAAVLFCHGLLVDITVPRVIIAWDASWEFKHLSRLFFFCAKRYNLRWIEILGCVVTGDVFGMVLDVRVS